LGGSFLGIENATTIDKREVGIMGLKLDDVKDWNFLGGRWNEDRDDVIHLPN
jgi:hypothetical protein